MARTKSEGVFVFAMVAAILFATWPLIVYCVIRDYRRGGWAMVLSLDTPQDDVVPVETWT